MNSKLKSILKAITWRILGTLDTFIISFFITRSAVISSTIASFEVITKMVLYYFHERVWEKVKNER